MKFQIIQEGWSIGDKLIPAGTIIDAASNDDWTNLARGRVPPPNVLALDQEAADMLFKHYPAYRVHVAEGLRR